MRPWPRLGECALRDQARSFGASYRSTARSTQAASPRVRLLPPGRRRPDLRTSYGSCRAGLPSPTASTLLTVINRESRLAVPGGRGTAARRHSGPGRPAGNRQQPRRPLNLQGRARTASLPCSLTMPDGWRAETTVGIVAACGLSDVLYQIIGTAWSGRRLARRCLAGRAHTLTKRLATGRAVLVGRPTRCPRRLSDGFVVTSLRCAQQRRIERSAAPAVVTQWSRTA